MKSRAAERSKLLEDGARQRKPYATQERYVPTDWDDSLPYGGKVYLARKKKPDGWLCIALQVSLVVFALWLVYFGWYYTDVLHFHLTKVYAHYGNMEAQAIIGHKLLTGSENIEKNHSEAMHWLKKAAKQGHPHSAYNVAIGHLQGLDAGLNKGEAHEYIKHAAQHGVSEAKHVLERLCSQGMCD